MESTKLENQNPAAEQYELHSPPLHRFAIDRRKFFKILGSGVAVAFVVTDAIARELIPFGEATTDESQINAWIHVGENNRVTVFTGKVEVGQNIRTSLAQAVAEELHVPVSAIDMVMGDTDLVPYDRGTFGSLSTPRMAPQLRKAAASAREMLTEMAAKEWNVDKNMLKAEDGKVINTKTKKSVEYGQIAKGKKLLKGINENISLTPVDQWKVGGKSIAKVNGKSFVTGAHKYVSDMKLPGMLYGRVLRPVAYEATPVSVDLSRAVAIPGVVAIHDGSFIGVAAPDIQTADRALMEIRVEWKATPQPSRKEIFEYLVKNSESGRSSQEKGNVNEAFEKSEVKIEQTFHVDYIAHAPLEPRAALAEWKDDSLTVWTGTQRPFGVQEELSEVFHIPKEKVRVIMPDTGSGYGGKHTGDAALEAARLAKAAQKPVKLVWTREEEFTWAYFRPAGVITVKAGAMRDGTIAAWEFHNYNSGGSGIITPYEAASQEVKFHPVKSPLRQGSYRGLAGTANIFARECAMDDLARELKVDSLEFRLKNLKDERLTDVLKAAAKAFGWGKEKPPKGHGYGIACGIEKGGYVATCAEVAAGSGNGVKVIRAVTAFECGAVINPNHLESQIEGSVIQGLGGALFEYIDFKDGKILNPAFSRYRVPRFEDTPRSEVVIVNRKDLPSAGAGETPIFGIAPAIRNAIADATGKRLYTLPLVPEGVTV